MIDIQSWMQEYKKAIVNYFGDRVVFIGLQGSRARNEANENSDIDVVLILDRAEFEDLVMYRDIVSRLPNRELLCGFVSGRDELSNWSEFDLFQFYFDTVALQGSLDEIIPEISKGSAKQAALVGACNIYHACSHNFIHAQDTEALKMIYKSAFFVMQADYYCKTGAYIRSRGEMKDKVQETDKPVLQALMNSSVIDQNSLQAYSKILLEWSGELIRQYGKG